MTEAHIESGYHVNSAKSAQKTPRLNKLDNDLFANPLRNSLLEDHVETSTVVFTVCGNRHIHDWSLSSPARRSLPKSEVLGHRQSVRRYAPRHAPKRAIWTDEGAEKHASALPAQIVKYSFNSTLQIGMLGSNGACSTGSSTSLTNVHVLLRWRLFFGPSVRRSHSFTFSSVIPCDRYQLSSRYWSSMCLCCLPFFDAHAPCDTIGSLRCDQLFSLWACPL